MYCALSVYSIPFELKGLDVGTYRVPWDQKATRISEPDPDNVAGDKKALFRVEYIDYPKLEKK